MNFLKDSKVQWTAVAIIFIVILSMGASIRLSNWDLLTDQTTGEKIPLALDPYYFLRAAETIVENGGSLPAIDDKRVPGFDIGWSSEIMPQVVVKMWNTANIFGDHTLREVNIFSPVFFFGVGFVSTIGLRSLLSLCFAPRHRITKWTHKHHIYPQSICSHSLHNLIRIYHISSRLTHLLTIFAQ